MKGFGIQKLIALGIFLAVGAALTIYLMSKNSTIEAAREEFRYPDPTFSERTVVFSCLKSYGGRPAKENADLGNAARRAHSDYYDSLHGAISDDIEQAEVGNLEAVGAQIAGDVDELYRHINEDLGCEVTLEEN